MKMFHTPVKHVTMSNYPNQVVFETSGESTSSSTVIGVETHNHSDLDKMFDCVKCNQPNSFDDMVECETCMKWFHFKCANVTESVKDVPWSCTSCCIHSTTYAEINSLTSSSPISNLLYTQSKISQNRNFIPTIYYPNSNEYIAQMGTTTKTAQINNGSIMNHTEMYGSHYYNQTNRSRSVSYMQPMNELTQVPLQQMYSNNQHQKPHFESSINMMCQENLSNLQKNNVLVTSLPNQRDMNSDVKEYQITRQDRMEAMSRMYDDCDDSVSTKSSSLSSTCSLKKKIELEKLEEIRRMHENYIDQKYKILLKDDSKSGSSKSSRVSSSSRLSKGSFTKNSTIPLKTNSDTTTESKKQSEEEAGSDMFKILTRRQLAARQALPRDLPIFSGEPSEWNLFYSSFNMSSTHCGFSNQENIIRLQRCLKGPALNAVKSMLVMSNNVNMIIETLKMRFGRPDQIIFRLIEKVKAEPQVKQDNLNSLINFAIEVKNLVETIKGAEMNQHMNNPVLIRELMEKLPSAMKLEWGKVVLIDQSDNLEKFSDWLYRLAEAASLVAPFKHESNAANYIEKKSTVQKGFHNIHQFKSICIVCQNKDEIHELSNCPKFNAFNRRQKWDVIKKYKLCAFCFVNHRGSCDKKCGVNGCIRRHNPVLHINESSGIALNDCKNFEPSVELKAVNLNNINDHVEVEVEAKSVNLHNTNVHGEGLPSIIMRIVPVVLYGKNSSISTYALLDEESSLSMIEESLVEQLELDGPTSDLCLLWTSEESRIEPKSKMVQLNISGKNMRKSYCMKGIRSIRRLSLPKQSLSLKDLKDKYDYLKSIPFEEYNEVRPKILIGADNLSLTVSLRTKEGGINCPIATLTRLGWVIGGPTNSSPKHSVSVNNFHYCDCSSDQQLHNLIKEYFSLENFGVKSSSMINDSTENIRAMKIMQDSTVLLNNGHYETGLLWKYDNVQLPNSYQMAKRRLLCLEKKMEADLEFSKKMNDHIDDYIKKGYIRKLVSSEIESANKSWYLPIFVTHNPNKPKKFRIVWDAAAKVDGIALNDVLLKGPDLLTPLHRVLNCFREHKVAICGDLKEMFHQVYVRRSDQDVQRFLWRNGDRSKEPDVYVMMVMTFGASCSPTLAQYVKNFNAGRFKNQFDRGVKSILHHHYVDDWLQSFPSIQETIDVAKEVRFIHQSGGFEIRNWISNSSDVLEALGEKPSDPISLQLDVESNKVLGMWWCPSSDCFLFKISVKIHHQILNPKYCPTKREVLRTLMSTFDPLGLISHFLAQLKFLLQEIWRTSVGWDEMILSDQYEKWQKWIKLLPKITELRIPRCYSVKMMCKYKLELHTFVDASADGYAAVSYIRFEHEDGIECRLIGSKTKVAPQKMITIPRLELLAAVLGTRLAISIQQWHDIKFESRYFWSDSATVLSWIRSDQRQFRQFVAFRIGEINENTNINEWRWVPSKSNVADLATKWRVQDDLSSPEWFNGPTFLHKRPQDWPTQLKSTTIIPVEEYSLSHCQVIWNVPIIPDVTRFSKWTKYRNTQAFVNCFIHNINSRSKWFTTTKKLEKGDIVIIVDDQNPRSYWPKGKIIEIIKNPIDNEVRQAIVQTNKGVYKRPANKLAILDVMNDSKADSLSNPINLPGAGNVGAKMNGAKIKI